MYKVKLSPEEALETIKLRMKYDSSKTLTENVGIITELGGGVITQQKGDTSCVTFPSGKNFVDVKTKSKYSLRLFNDGTLEQISDKEKGTWSCAGNCEIKFLMNKGQSSNVSMSFTETVLGCSSGKIVGQGEGSKTTTLPTELKDVKAFQTWLDTNKPGWHDKYNTLGTDPAKGYGKFGPRTTKAWATYKDEYLKGTNTPTVAPTPAKSEEEEAEAVYGDNPSDIIANN
jgi:hypothetical protein